MLWVQPQHNQICASAVRPRAGLVHAGQPEKRSRTATAVHRRRMTGRPEPLARLSDVGGRLARDQ